MCINSRFSLVFICITVNVYIFCEGRVGLGETRKNVFELGSLCEKTIREPREKRKTFDRRLCSEWRRHFVFDF